MDATHITIPTQQPDPYFQSQPKLRIEGGHDVNINFQLPKCCCRCSHDHHNDVSSCCFYHMTKKTRRDIGCRPSAPPQPCVFSPCLTKQQMRMIEQLRPAVAQRLPSVDITPSAVPKEKPSIDAPVLSPSTGASDFPSTYSRPELDRSKQRQLELYPLPEPTVAFPPSAGLASAAMAPPAARQSLGRPTTAELKSHAFMSKSRSKGMKGPAGAKILARGNTWGERKAAMSSRATLTRERLEREEQEKDQKTGNYGPIMKESIGQCKEPTITEHHFLLQYPEYHYSPTEGVGLSNQYSFNEAENLPGAQQVSSTLPVVTSVPLCQKIGGWLFRGPRSS